MTQLPLPPPPVPAPPQETYSVVVTDVPVRDVLFALARDAKRQRGHHGDIQGNVTMNAIDQTLPQILDRISRQVSLRYQLEIRQPGGHARRAVLAQLPHRLREPGAHQRGRGQRRHPGRLDGRRRRGGGSERRRQRRRRRRQFEMGNISRTTVKSVSDNGFWAMVSGNVRQIVTGKGQTAEGASDRCRTRWW